MGSLGLPANSASFSGCGLFFSRFSIRRLMEVCSELSGVFANRLEWGLNPSVSVSVQNKEAPRQEDASVAQQNARHARAHPLKTSKNIRNVLGTAVKVYGTL